jgi:para-aminobenzoate synthetase component 1
MLKPWIKEIQYCTESKEYFFKVRTLGHAVWLDSGQQSHPHRRFDILAAAPTRTWQLTDSSALPATLRANFSHAVVSEPLPFELPFCGGWLGWLGYEAAHHSHGLPARTAPSLPLASFGWFPWAILQDHQQQRSWLVGQPDVSPEARSRLLDTLTGSGSPPPPGHVTSPFSASTGRARYTEQFDQVQAYIQAGDCYQVNLARHWQAGFSGDPLSAYLMLRERFSGPFSAYLEQPDAAILCLSPERFLRLEGREVVTRPIKGTRPRSDNHLIDKRLHDELKENPKDSAENLMIVDLMRNDLGRVCEPGSVQVPALFAVETFANVHHLVSTVRGRLAEGHTLGTLLAATLPGGSITGAPKRRAMEIINALEPVPRGIYCGNIGYASACGQADFNIAIRTLLQEAGRMHCWGGGGLVADSDCGQEFQETLDKVGGMMALLGQVN